MATEVKCHPDRKRMARGWCRPCYYTEWTKKQIPRCHPDKPYMARGLCQGCYQRVRLYGFTDEVELKVYLDSRHNRCEICSSTKNLHIDHDHKTNKVRGLLCQNCNLTVGHAGDDPERLRDLADYLERGAE